MFWLATYWDNLFKGDMIFGLRLLLLHHDEFQLLYNCSFYEVDSIPLASRQHKFLGGLLVAVYFVCTILYIPCLYAMAVCEHRNRASYRLMFLLGVIHVTDLQFCGLMTGVFAVLGVMYCEYPMTIYICGGIAVSCWCASTMTSMILGINRCCELYSSELAYRLFGGKRISFWYALPIGYFFYIWWASPPGIFNGVQLAWFFNPHLSYYDDSGLVYKNVPHTVNNFIVCLTESSIYLTLVGLYIRVTKMKTGEARKSIQREKKIYVQVILVGTIHFVAGSAYVIMQFVPVGFYGTLLASSMYLSSQGVPPLIYLGMNRTIRNVLLQKLGLRKSAEKTTTADPLGRDALATITSRERSEA